MAIFQKTGKPKLIATRFYSPIFLLFQIYDIHPHRENEILQILREHVDSFESCTVLRNERIFYEKGKERISNGKICTNPSCNTIIYLIVQAIICHKAVSSARKNICYAL